jgi:hypothetical protein
MLPVVAPKARRLLQHQYFKLKRPIHLVFLRQV